MYNEEGQEGDSANLLIREKDKGKTQNFDG